MKENFKVSNFTGCLLYARSYSKYVTCYSSFTPLSAVNQILLLPCCCLVTKSWPALCKPMNYSIPGSSVHEISRQEYWSGLPVFPPRDLPNPGIEPWSPALKVYSFPTELPVPWIKYWLKATIYELNISLFLSFTITILLFQEV